MASLKDTIAVVAGASRGAGRGIALALGEAGATVYVTARSTREGPTTEDREETIEGTAERVDRLGGEGVPVRCDHTRVDDVAALFDRVGEERGRVDVLVNNVWGGYERYDRAEWALPFWKLPWKRWELMARVGLEAKLRTARHAAPLLLESDRGLLANVSSPVGAEYVGQLFYHVVNHAVDTMTIAMAGDLEEHGVAAVSIQPGFTRTERVLEAYEEEPEKREADRIDEVTHSPRYVGRAVTALATDPDRMERTGGVFPVGELALAYGFTDVDGRRPQWPPPEPEDEG